MGSDYFTNPPVFLIDTLFGLYIVAIMLRFLLQWVRADFYNPLSQFLVKVTNPPLIPLRRILPGIGGVDLASIALMFILTAIKLILIFMLRGFSVPILSLLILTLADLVELFLMVFLVAIIIQVILSWVAPHQHNPISLLLRQLTEPLLKPIRRLIPSLGGLDFSPLIALILIQLSMMIIVPPIKALA